MHLRIVSKKQKPIDTSKTADSDLSESNDLEDSKQLKSVQIQAVSYEGPLPLPTGFQQYESVHPGSAIAILEMAEKEQNHRIAWETTYLRARNSHHTLGQIRGFASVIVCICGKSVSSQHQ